MRARASGRTVIAMATETLDLQTATRLKQQAAAMWDKGRYREVARRLEPLGVALVDAARVRGGMRVLDAAAGDGNVALEAAARGASVTALDLAGDMVRHGRARSEARGLRIDWVKADVESLPFPDGRFDRILSNLGVVYAPRPPVAAAELVRCLAPRGAIALTSWTADSFQGQATGVVRGFLPSTPAPDPCDWARRDVLQRLFRGSQIDVRPGVLVSEFPSAREWWAQALKVAPPLAALREALSASDIERLGEQLTRLAERFDAGDGRPLLLRQDYVTAVIHPRSG